MRPIFTPALSLLALCPLACAQLSDPSFENTVPLDGFPAEYGVWGGVVNSISSGDGDIHPRSGEFMLKIDSTSPACAIEGGVAGFIYQLQPVPAGYAPGDAVTASVWLNRVDHPMADTEMSVFVYAYDGTPDTWPTGCATTRPYLNFDRDVIATDTDPATWQQASITLEIPAGTTFVAIALGAHEDVEQNDHPPFHGHYFDDAALSFSHPTCSPADLAEPFGVLDFSDIFAFLGSFVAMDPAVDLAEPFGVFDFSDVFAFLQAFGAGCP